MYIRQLEKIDASYMLEWMHDERVNRYFRFDAANQTMDDVINFIEKSQIDLRNKHFAVVDDSDIYQGTVSLKGIDYTNLKAEYAVCFRYSAQGKGYSQFGTKKILDYAFNELSLNRIYLNVLSSNNRANHFYEKMGFVFEGETVEDLKINDKFENLKWYRILKEEFEITN